MHGRVCIIGAGSSGLAAVKTLKQRGLPFDCFEMGSGLGGNWRYGNDNGRSAAYDSLRIDTSKDRMAYSDFPMPRDYPNYLHHSQVLEYFEKYADHFGLEPHISFGTRVTRVAPVGGRTEARRRPARGPAASESTRTAVMRSEEGERTAPRSAGSGRANQPVMRSEEGERAAPRSAGSGRAKPVTRSEEGERTAPGAAGSGRTDQAVTRSEEGEWAAPGAAESGRADQAVTRSSEDGARATRGPGAGTDRYREETGPGWEVTIEPTQGGDAETRLYSAVLVCNGHHWSPRLPEFPGELEGEVLHSRDYRNADGLEGKSVLVLGVGNSGVDIACDVAPVASRTLLASRRSAHVIPRRLLGRPTDKWTTPLGSRLPLGLQRAFYSAVVRLARGRQESYGMPLPPTQLLNEHPTLSTELLPLVKQGKVVPKPNIERLAGREVEFVDGSSEPVDLLICATGYKISFPFLDDELFSTAANHFPLYGKVAHPSHPGLYFIGLIQPLGAIMPLAELQAKWVAALLSGRARLPDRATMLEAIGADQQALEERYVHSKRHTIQVDFFPYKRWLQGRLG